MTAAKICGLCRPEDAAAAAAAGAAYVGVVLVPGRVRGQNLDDAAAIFAAAGGVPRVGVFADPSAEEVLAAAAALRLDVVQLHGREAPDLVAGLRSAGVARVWKAIPVSAADALAAELRTFAPLVDGVLLDGGAGGQGATFDWSLAAAARRHLPAHCALVVAGGLHPGNVAAAVRALAPDVVDVSSGVESAPGIKSAVAVREFVAAARRVALPLT